MNSCPEARARLLFVTLSNIGDLILTTPVLEALHAHWPTLPVDVIADARSSELLRHCPYLGTLHHRDKRAGWRGVWELVARLRQHRYEAVVDLRTDFLPWLLNARHRQAHWRRARQHGPHAVEEHFAVLAPLLSPASPIPPARVWLSEEDMNDARAKLAGLPLARCLAVAPGANWPGKRWPAGHYAALLEELAAEFTSVVLLGGAEDAAIAHTLRAASPLPCLDLCGQTTLCQAAAVLDHAAAFVGNDSGLGHLAAARGVPTCTLFGPGRPQRYRPWGPRAHVLEAPERSLSRLEPAAVARVLRGL